VRNCDELLPLPLVWSSMPANRPPGDGCSMRTRPVDVELLGDHHRQQCAHALAHLELDAQSVTRSSGVIRKMRSARTPASRSARAIPASEGERQAGDRGGRLENSRRDGLTGVIACSRSPRRDARRDAGVYVPHRQTCVLNVSSICASSAPARS
jgi:hypothetical protein